MIISNEIRLHDSIGNATSIGAIAILLKLNPSFHPPCIAGFHLYDSSTKQLDKVPNYQFALKAAKEPNTILVWREDLTLNSPLGTLTTTETINKL
jgi:hypothetical protein